MKDQRRFWHNAHLDMSLMHGRHVEYAYPRHAHDHFAICVIEQGVQSFTFKGTKYVTPPSGIILINPEEMHTGEPATEHGFVIRSLYPQMDQLKRCLAFDHSAPLYFRDLRVDDPYMAQRLVQLHDVLQDETEPLTVESVFTDTMMRLFTQYGELGGETRPLGQEKQAVQQAKAYLEDRFSESIHLADLANHVALSPYYLLRVFQAEVGLTPHAYLQDLRVRQAQKLIIQGVALADVAVSVGFCHQSHLHRYFKRIMGITPGRFAKQVGS